MASPSAAAAAGLYRDVLGRPPDDAGLSTSADASGSLDLFAHPGPQPPVAFVLKYPGS